MKKVYFPNLDGLRFFAFFVVLVSHLAIFTGFTATSYTSTKTLFLDHGDLGVAFFFVLSGFLITYLLLQEKEEKGDISLKHFYIRRSLRILPVYFLVILCGFFILPYGITTPLSISIEAPLSHLAPFVFFLGNIDIVYTEYVSVVLGVLWSIAVEEQFYLLWPLVCKKIKTSIIPWILSVVIICSFVYRFVHSGDNKIIRYMTFSVFSDLAIGSLVAYFVYMKKEFVHFFEILPRWVIALNYIMIFFYAVFRGIIPLLVSGFTFQLATALQSVIFCILFSAVIMEQCFAKNSFFKLGNSKVLTYLGKISYGLYAYHMIALTCVLWVSVAFFNLPLEYTSIVILFGIGVSTAILSFVFAQVSYMYMEKPILKLKEKVGYVK